MTTDILHDHFSFSYRADCRTCKQYVGPDRESKEETDSDARAHKKVIGNEDHDVKVKVTQSFHI
jgi:hypothetical protein